MRDWLNTASSGNDAFPAAGNVKTHWRNQAEARDDNPSL
jgi:hypothetical protein